MSVESTLTRELDIRFIDARVLTTEAKLNLGIEGYPSLEQTSELIAEATRIFEERDDSTNFLVQEKIRTFYE